MEVEEEVVEDRETVVEVVVVNLTSESTSFESLVSPGFEPALNRSLKSFSDLVTFFFPLVSFCTLFIKDTPS